MIFGEESLRPAFRNRVNLFFFGTLNNMDFSRNFSIDTGIAVACFCRCLCNALIITLIR